MLGICNGIFLGLLLVQAARKNIPMLVEAEKKRKGLDDLLDFATYAVCSAKFPLAWTGAPCVPSALLSMLLRFPKLKFVIATLGEDGCMMLERSINGECSCMNCVAAEHHLNQNYKTWLVRKKKTLLEVFPTMFVGGSDAEEMDVHSLLESLKQRKDDSKSIPTSISSVVTKLTLNGTGTVTGRLFVGTAEKIPPPELVDTTGAGDAFIGAVLYALCASMPPEKMLPFAAQVAAAGCRALGARTGLPLRTDPRLAGFL
ncbi:hypothetical protein GQ457_02G004210 [Hibiscus cannabinus]